MNEPSIALQVVASVATFLGSLFFLAGAIGFVRLPDFYARLHAPTMGRGEEYNFLFHQKSGVDLEFCKSRFSGSRRKTNRRGRARL